jgi:hypothetical protein
MPAPGPSALFATSTGSPITVYPADLFTSTNTPNPNVTTGGTGVTANSGVVQTTASGGFYTQIQMVPASGILTGVIGAANTSSGAANPQAGASVYLPLPWKINDIEMHLWNDLSFMDNMPIISEALKIAHGGLRATGTNLTVNPFQYMMYKQPAFREFELAWSFSPNNANESETLCQILNYLKTGALPAYTSNIFTLDLPWIALVRLNPNKFLFDFKPAAVTSVNIDFTGSNHGPSFYNDGAPAIVNFTLGIKEVEIQVRSDTAWRGGSLAAAMIGTGGVGAAAGGAAGGLAGGIGVL